MKSISEWRVFWIFIFLNMFCAVRSYHELAICWSRVRRPKHYTTKPLYWLYNDTIRYSHSIVR